MVMDKVHKTLRKEVIIGKAQLLDLEALVPGRPVRLLAMGHLAGSRSATTDNPKIEPLTAVDYLVIAAGGDIPTMIEAISKIKEISPDTKVIIADSQDTPFLPDWQADKPPEVESVIYVPQKLMDMSRALLHQKAGILTGRTGGLSGGVAFTLADKIGINATVAFSMTNFDLSLLEQLQAP